MDQRVIPFDYLRDLGDDDFYVHLNSNDAKSQKLSELGVRTHWRNFLPLTLELKDGDWEVALTQIMLKNVQHVDKELLIYDGDGKGYVEYRFPLLKSVFTDTLGLMDATVETLRRHNVESLVAGPTPFMSLKILITWNSFKTCIMHKYELPSLDDLVAATDESDKLTTSGFVKLLKQCNPERYKMYSFSFNNRQQAENFLLENEDFVSGGQPYNHATRLFYSFFGDRNGLGIYFDSNLGYRIDPDTNVRIFISNSLLPFVRSNPKGQQMQDSKGNQVWRTWESDYLMDTLTEDAEGDASHLFPFFHYSPKPSTNTLVYRVSRPLALQAEGQTIPFKLLQRWVGSLSSFLKMWESRTIEDVTHASLFQVHVHDLPFKYPLVTDKGEKLQGLIYSLLNAKKETNVFDQPRENHLRYFPLENVKVKHLDVKVSNLDGIKEAPTFLTGYSQLTLHFRRNYLDLQRDRPHDGEQ